MKTLKSVIVLVTIISSFTMFMSFWAVPKFNKQQNNYLASSKCIAGLTDSGFDRINIEVNGFTCALK